MPNIYLAQINTILGDKKKNLEKIYSFIEEASYHSADLVLFPELALTGLSTEKKTKELAESVNGTSMTMMRKWAKKFNIKIILGFPEIVTDKVYNSACFINNDGELIGVHRKAHLWEDEGLYYTPGECFNVWETDIGKIGIMICFDSQFPESARLLALQGAEMILVPTGNMSPFETLQPFNIQSRAEENQIFICTTNLVGMEGSLNFFGESTAASPYGEMLFKADQSEMGVAVDINLKKVIESRESYNYLDARRPDLYEGITESKKN